MGRPLTEKELKRFGRVLSGHTKDKDRARWKRKAQGQAGGKEQRREHAAAAEDPDQELEPPDEET